MHLWMVRTVSSHTLGLQLTILFAIPILTLIRIEFRVSLFPIFLVRIIVLQPFLGHICFVGFIIPLGFSSLGKQFTYLGLSHDLTHHCSELITLTYRMAFIDCILPVQGTITMFSMEFKMLLGRQTNNICWVIIELVE